MNIAEKQKIAVVVPAYNEPGVNRTLNGLYIQSNRPESIHHFVVDNGSTDDTRARIDAFITSHEDFPATVITEDQKGTGVAADAGFRAAIEAGYSIIARTDADTVPAASWTSRIVENFQSEDALQLLGGSSLPLKDEYYRFGDELILPAAIKAARYALSLKNLDQRYLHVAIGHNMATRANAYTEVGGFIRASIDEIDEDSEFSLRIVDTFGPNAILFDSKVVVETSMRRIRTYGIAGTALHHLFPELRKYRKAGVDIR